MKRSSKLESGDSNSSSL